MPRNGAVAGEWGIERGVYAVPMLGASRNLRAGAA